MTQPAPNNCERPGRGLNQTLNRPQAQPAASAWVAGSGGPDAADKALGAASVSCSSMGRCKEGVPTAAPATPTLAASASDASASARGHKARALANSFGWLAYVAAVFFCCIQREPRWWTLLPFVLPLGYWLGAYLAQRMGGARWQWLWQAGLLLGLVAVLLALVQTPAGTALSPQRIRWFYFLQEAVMLWLLVAVFARSLLPGKTPLCSAVAVLSHPVMTPAVWRYTRGVTLAWALWIAGLWLVSASLFVVASAQAWAFFSMGVLPVLIAAFFVAEVLLGRRLFLPRADRSSLWATLATVRKVNWTAFFMQLLQGPQAAHVPGATADGGSLAGHEAQPATPGACASKGQAMRTMP